MNVKLKRYVFVGLALWQALAFANPLNQVIQELLNSPYRPTIAELKQALQPWPGQNPFQQNPQGHRVYNIAHAPNIIAQFEKAFPGATWAPLGRDSVMLGDLLDAFYQAIGQNDRVSRLNASGSSFGNNQPDFLARFLQSNGLNYDRIADAPPFVIFDNTSYSPHSQSTQLVNAGFHAWRARGGQPGDLVRKFNLLSTGSGHAIDANLNREAFLQNQATEANSHGRPLSILLLPNAQQFMYQAEWHGTFGNIIQLTNGRMAGMPGAASHAQIRSHILWEMFEFITLTSQPHFVEQVRQQAASLGYEFPMKRVYENTAPKPIPPEEQFERAASQLGKMMDAMGEHDEQTRYLSTNGQSLNSWLQSVGGAAPLNALMLHFIDQLPKLREARRITGKDFRRLLARAFGLAKMEAGFAERFIEIYKKSETLQKVMKERAGVFLESKQPDAAAVAAMYRYLEEAFKCQNLIIREAA